MSEKTIKAWHFLPRNKLLAHNDGRKVRLGRWLVHDGELDMCYRGLHASRKVMDALSYARDTLACRVEMGGEIIEGDDKLVAQKRRVLWWVDAEGVLRKFARMCAADVLGNWAAPDIVKQWLRTGDEGTRRAVHYAATTAARSAVGSAAYSASYSAAYSAAYSGAYSAYSVVSSAYSAARNAAHSAARSAVSSAAFSAAYSGVYSAARKAQEKRLVRMLREARKK